MHGELFVGRLLLRTGVVLTRFHGGVWPLRHPDV